ncbi:MAG: hypothetical protein ACI4LA_03420 [Emergencia sp.]
MRELIKRYVNYCERRKEDVLEDYMRPKIRTWDEIIASYAKAAGEGASGEISEK